MSTTLSELVNPFQGCEATNLPAPQGLARAWNWRKACAGNTHPGATRPFGMVSASAYSGAYSSGYGRNGYATKHLPKRIHERPTALGFTHFQHSGGGDAGVFYNYLRVVPLTALEGRQRRWDLIDEAARPGYYAATLSPGGVRAELAAGRKAIMHRYQFPAGAPANVLVDLSSGGLLLPGREAARLWPESVSVQLIGDRAAAISLVFRGWPIHCYLETDLPGSRCGFWTSADGQVAGRSMTLANPPQSELGLWFAADGATGPVHVRLGFSFRSVEQARANAAETSLGFDALAAAAAQEWEEHLSRIVVDGGSSGGDERRTFYSCLYHSLIKPADAQNESPYWPGDGPFFVDLATMWDLYKTQLPLMLAVYPQRGRKLVQAFAEMLAVHGGVPNGYLMEATFDKFADQAAGLALHTLADAFVRGIEGVDWPRVLDLARRALACGRGGEFLARGAVQPWTHTLDLVCACRALALVARGLGQDDAAAELERYTANWRRAYDPATGLLHADGQYYEGTVWNYSFRPHPHMSQRVTLAGGPAGLVEKLDTFFGYGDEVDQSAPFQRRIRDNRFEGLNNEPDMETPYAYLWAGRHDRTAQIVRAALRWQFGPGAGGLPGNNDSGGLSSWYVWNALGLYPLTGRDLYLIGSPLFGEATLRLARGEFRVRSLCQSVQNVYVSRATLNGQPLDRAFLSIDEVERGGELVLTMSDRPEEWARVPPPD